MSVGKLIGAIVLYGLVCLVSYWYWILSYKFRAFSTAEIESSSFWIAFVAVNVYFFSYFQTFLSAGND